MVKYEDPQFIELGSLSDLTLQSFSKVGSTPDVFTSITNGAVIGSFVYSP